MDQVKTTRHEETWPRNYIFITKSILKPEYWIICKHHGNIAQGLNRLYLVPGIDLPKMSNDILKLPYNLILPNCIYNTISQKKTKEKDPFTGHICRNYYGRKFDILLLNMGPACKFHHGDEILKDEVIAVITDQIRNAFAVLDHIGKVYYKIAKTNKALDNMSSWKIYNWCLYEMCTICGWVLACSFNSTEHRWYKLSDLHDSITET